MKTFKMTSQGGPIWCMMNDEGLESCSKCAAKAYMTLTDRGLRVFCEIKSRMQFTHSSLQRPFNIFNT